MKLSSPVVESMENLLLSSPPLIAQLTAPLAVNVWTVVVFSLTVFVELMSPGSPDGPVMRSCFSSTSVILILNALDMNPPSDEMAVIVMSWAVLLS